jgi:hypothetical protein
LRRPAAVATPRVPLQGRHNGHRILVQISVGQTRAVEQLIECLVGGDISVRTARLHIANRSGEVENLQAAALRELLECGPQILRGDVGEFAHRGACTVGGGNTDDGMGNNSRDNRKTQKRSHAS